MSVSISDYVAGHSNWVAEVLKQWLDDDVLTKIDTVELSAYDGSIRCTITVFHWLSCYDFPKISAVLGERYWNVVQSSLGGVLSITFLVTDDEL